jgi:hypothetical protein
MVYHHLSDNQFLIGPGEVPETTTTITVSSLVTTASIAVPIEKMIKTGLTYSSALLFIYFSMN